MGNAQSQKKSNKGSMYFNEELIDSIDFFHSFRMPWNQYHF